MAALCHRALQGCGVILLFSHTRFDISQRTEKVLYIFKELVVDFFWSFGLMSPNTVARTWTWMSVPMCWLKNEVMGSSWLPYFVMSKGCVFGRSKLSQQVPHISLRSLTKEVTSFQKYGTVGTLIGSRWALLWPLQICNPAGWSFDFSFGFVSHLGYYIVLFTSGA